MTKLLIRLFAADCAADDSHGRMRVGRLSGVTGMVCNALLCVLKLLVGALSGSVSIMADAMNNLSDAASSIVTLVGFRLSELPPDKRHPYGHARFEYLSGLAVAAMILLIGAELLKTSVVRILHPAPVEFTLAAACVLAGSIAVKLWLSRFNTVLGSRIQSAALLATAQDSRGDCLSTAGVLLAGCVEALTSWQVDGIVGLVLAGYILYSGVRAAMDTISPLLGEASNPELRARIAQLLRACPQVLGFHDLMVHDYGPSKRFASIHVEMDRAVDPMVSHTIIDNLERQCAEQLHVQLVIHYDPVVVGDPLLDRTRAQTEELLRQKDPRLTLHDFRMVTGAGHTNLIFDVPLPCDLHGQEDDIRRCVEEGMTGGGAQRYYAVITFDSEGFNV